jgi:hypothetical protein
MIRPDGLGNVINSIPSNIFTTSNLSKIGQVIGVVTGENLPTPIQYDRASKVIGSVIYAEVNTNGPIEITDSFDDTLYNQYEIAKPFFSSVIDYPLKGELVWIKEDFPSANAEIEGTAINTYYIGTISVWGSPQHNSVANYNLGATYLVNPNVKSLLPFDGDRIFQGRQGSALRFSSTTKLYNDKNEWSEIGSDSDPIAILTNGFSYEPKGVYHVEKINKDLSSIYLTSAQLIPLQTDKVGILNNLANPVDVSKYIGPQIIVNSDRVVLNSKKDDILIFAKNNIQLNTKNIINLNADERIHLNSKAIFLGPYDATHIPQPLLLGNNTFTLLSNIISSLYDLGSSLSSIVGSPEGSPSLDINSAGDNLMNSLERIIGDLNNILSKQNFTV